MALLVDRLDNRRIVNTIGIGEVILFPDCVFLTIGNLVFSLKVFLQMWVGMVIIRLILVQNNVFTALSDLVVPLWHQILYHKVLLTFWYPARY